LNRAVKQFSGSRLIMNSRQLGNSHQRHKFLRAEASRGILKFRVSEIAFPGVFKRYFPPQMLCCFVRILATRGTMPLKCPRHSTTSHGLNVSQPLNLLEYAFNDIQNWNMDALQFYLMVLIFVSSSG